MNFVLENDKEGLVLVAPLQGKTAEFVFSETNLDPNSLDSLVFWDRGEIYTFSTAALKVAGFLKAPWKYSKYLIYIPKWVRDPVYKFIAKNRYIWFGKQDTCRMATQEEKARFLD